MRNIGASGRTILSLAISALLAFWSSAPFAAPVIRPLGADEVVIAHRLLNEILKTPASGNIAARASDGAVAEPGSMVVELMNAARAKVLAVLQKAEISGELEVRAGRSFSGFIPRPMGATGSEHLNLTIYQNGNKLGDLTVGRQYQCSSVTPYAEFARTQ